MLFTGVCKIIYVFWLIDRYSYLEKGCLELRLGLFPCPSNHLIKGEDVADLGIRDATRSKSWHQQVRLSWVRNPGFVLFVFYKN